MLSVNDFPIIKEIQSLSTQKLELIHNKEDELNRVEKIKTLKLENTERKTSIDSQLLEKNMQVRHLENEANKKTQTLSKKKEQVLMLTSDKQVESMKSEIGNLEETIDSLEGEALELLEVLDPLNQEQKELSEFFKNIDQSIIEIEEVVKEEIKMIDESILTLNQRIQLSIDELTPMAKTKIQHIMKSEFIPFLTTLRNQSCSNCGMNMPSENMTHLLNMSKLITCSGCSRLIIE